MPKHFEEKILHYPAEFLYDVVADVKSYPDFLPWCVGVRLKENTNDHIYAEMLIGYKIYKEKFQCEVYLEPKHKIDVKYINGPFEYLKNHWQFIPLVNKEADEEYTKIKFFVDFEFKSKLLQSVISTIFTEAVHVMVKAFEKRAEELYNRTVDVK